MMMAGKSSVPTGSMWYMGLSVTRPCSRAVWSPRREAIQACAALVKTQRKDEQNKLEQGNVKAADCNTSAPNR